MAVRKICIATGTRADWGLLSPIARSLAARPDVEVAIVATNMHVDPRYGATAAEIVADGFEIAESFAITEGLPDSPQGRAMATARATSGMANVLAKLTPHLLVVLGDRFEMLGIATAAALMRVPIAHIAGGEISEGAVDDSIRHAITKLSSLHLTATEPYRQRVIRMGENPDLVINTGAIGVDSIMERRNPLSYDELVASLDGFELPHGSLMVTYHPATLSDISPDDGCREMLEALDRFPDRPTIITYPNNDAGSTDIIRLIESYAATRRERVKVVASLGRRRYHAALERVAAVIGNSSSGIVEVPSFHIPTVDIGSRQRGRTAGESVIHCGESAAEIAGAIRFALSPQGQQRALKAENPYYKPDTLAIITEAIATTPLDKLRTKRFYDGPDR